MSKYSEKEILNTNEAYEKDPRFLEYMRLLVKHSQDERNLVSAEQVFADIRGKYGWQ